MSPAPFSGATPGRGQKQMSETRESFGVCTASSLLVALMLAFLLSLLLTLADFHDAGEFWPVLGLRSLFLVWVALLSLFILCRLGRLLAGTSVVARHWVAFGTVQLVVLGLSLLVVNFNQFLVDPVRTAQESPQLFVLRNLGVSLIVCMVLLRYVTLYERWKVQVQSEAQARLHSLQARIRPHFLFNTLNTIASLIPEQPEQAEQATMDLADLLRTGLKDESSHLLADELELVRGYLRIESLRLGERLQVEWLLDDDLPLDRPVPALLLQPLVENAVIHGIAVRADGGRLVIRGALARFGRLRFVVENPLAAGDAPINSGNQLALDNIRQRLALAYEQGAGLKTEREDGLFRVTLTIPVEE